MKNDRDDVAIKFNEVSQSYDQQRKKLVPCFDDFYSIAVELAELDNDVPTVLDLGSGTGLFSSFILEKYPNAQITLIDLAEGMLEIAKARFEQYPNVTYIVSDYTKFDSLYKSEWKNNVENSGLNQDEISSAYERTKLDRMTTLDQQLHWLNDIGFVDVDCVYKFYNFVVLFARKLTS